MFARSILIALSVIVIASHGSFADTVILRNQERIRGVIESDEPSGVVILTTRGQRREITRNDILRVEKDTLTINQGLRAVYERNHASDDAAQSAGAGSSGNVAQDVERYLRTDNPNERSTLSRSIRSSGADGRTIVRDKLDKAFADLNSALLTGGLFERIFRSEVEQAAEKRRELVGLIRDGVQYPDDKRRPYPETQQKIDDLTRDLRSWLNSLDAEASLSNSSELAEEMREISLLEALVGSDQQERASFFSSLGREIKRKFPHVPAADELPAFPRDSTATDGERIIVNLVNEYRMMLGIHPLMPNEQLTQSARGHSGDMSRLGFFDHTSPVRGKESMSDRIRLAGYTFRTIGENIAMNPRGPTAAFEAWLHSPPHHRNIINSGFLDIGVGEAVPYYTQNFGSTPTGEVSEDFDTQDAASAPRDAQAGQNDANGNQQRQSEGAANRGTLRDVVDDNENVEGENLSNSRRRNQDNRNENRDR
ncbi:MAG: CAP domain-containing protein [Planctomycetes bacterium]|nr:CAP domain-containing protein [Planctomycetota bacterium]